MIKFLSLIFIKNRNDYKNQKVREQYGILCGTTGIFLNLILFAAKFTAGAVSASVAVTADAFNNLSDAASSVVSLLGFKLSSKKPDTEHPFGHGRLEYISGLVISFLILLMGIELMKSSVMSVVHPEPVRAGILPAAVMLVSVLVKFYMFCYNRSFARRLDSVSMEAASKDSLSDMAATSVAALSLFLSSVADFPVDGVAGVAVSLFIIYTGIDSARDTVRPLLGGPVSKEFVDEIEREVLSHPPISGIHDLVVHDYGPGRKMISLHAEVPGDRNVFELHDAIDNAERALSEKFSCQAVIHMDPIDTADEKLRGFKEILSRITADIGPELTVHDVRGVPGPTHTNLIFDVIRPFGFRLTDRQLRDEFQRRMGAVCPDVNCVVTVDNPYC